MQLLSLPLSPLIPFTIKFKPQMTIKLKNSCLTQQSGEYLKTKEQLWWQLVAKNANNSRPLLPKKTDDEEIRPPSIVTVKATLH